MGLRPILLAVLATASLACSSGASRPAASGQPIPPQQVQSRTLNIAVRAEPVSLASVSVDSTGLSDRSTTRLFNAELELQDPSEAAHPYLAEGLPQLNTESWQVTPDGRMQTTYRLKPNLQWHDGNALSAEDFLFAWRVYASPEFSPSALPPINQMEEVQAPDSQTVVIRWHRPYPGAGALYEKFQPLPRHILEPIFRQGTLDNVAKHAYWSTEYVGLGPYRLVRWEPGALIEAVAFDAHVLGRPKIDRLVVKFISNENTALANMLAEEIDYATSVTLRYEQALTLEREWQSNRAGTVILIPIQPRFIQFQLRPEVASPRAILDLRVRRALAHTIDKPGIDDALFDGKGAVTDTMLHRRIPYFSDIDRAITKYAHDPRRAEQLVNEAGLTKGADGIYLQPGGERLAAEFWGDAGTQFERELAAIADGWLRSGIETRQQLITTSQYRDGELRSSFPAMYSTASGTATEDFLSILTSAQIPAPANRWVGNNRGGWNNAEYERLWDTFNTTLDRSARNRVAADMEKLVSEELPMLMLFHNFHVVAHLSRLQGPDPRALRDLMVWNVHTWEMR